MMYSLLSLATMLSVASSLKMCTYNYMGTAPEDACTATGTDEDENCSGDFDRGRGRGCPRPPRQEGVSGIIMLCHLAPMGRVDMTDRVQAE